MAEQQHPSAAAPHTHTSLQLIRHTASVRFFAMLTCRDPAKWLHHSLKTIHKVSNCFIFVTKKYVLRRLLNEGM
jgi:hypothetical protein